MSKLQFIGELLVRLLIHDEITYKYHFIMTIY